MYHSNAVQKFLNGQGDLPARSTQNGNYHIFMLSRRKHTKWHKLQKQVQPASLSSVELKVGGEVGGEVMTQGSLPTGLSVDLLETFNLRDDVQRYRGVVSQAGHLFTVGNLLNWPPQTTCHRYVFYKLTFDLCSHTTSHFLCAVKAWVRHW